ncbi:MAG: FeoB-associated Cys-rich membrane protein [Erysipelotrichales bacterium]|nr:FeoB-associated Cys-rich membrane protein [Erysipelotrichales bacterium]
MLDYIVNNISTIIILFILIIILSLAIKKLIDDRNHGCGGNCSNCGSSSVCHSVKELRDDYEKGKF